MDFEIDSEEFIVSATRKKKLTDSAAGKKKLTDSAAGKIKLTASAAGKKKLTKEQVSNDQYSVASVALRRAARLRKYREEKAVYQSSLTQLEELKSKHRRLVWGIVRANINMQRLLDCQEDAIDRSPFVFNISNEGYAEVEDLHHNIDALKLDWTNMKDEITRLGEENGVLKQKLQRALVHKAATNVVGPSASQSSNTFESNLQSGVGLDNLSENNFHCPPPEFSYVAKASRLHKLDCSHTNIQSLPECLAALVSLQELDCSHTNIRSLPECLPALVSLQKLILKSCQLLMELPPQVGKLPNLEVLDLDETEVFDLPQEIRRLVKLKFLRVSFYGYMNRGKKLRQNPLIHPKTISTLSQLAELSIAVNPDDERWYNVVGYVIEEACSLKNLGSLALYVPDVEILEKRKPGSTSLSCYPLDQFRLTVGQHTQRFMSPVPKEVEAHFQAWNKCMQFVKGKSIPNEIKKVLGSANAFYLDHHATATSLSDFEIENLRKLEFCLLEECDKIETILDGGESSEGSALLNLQYLHIYLLENLVTIWRNPDNDQSLSRLKFLALHECQELSEIFSVRLLANLTELEALIVEDCPQVTSVVTLLSSDNVPDTHFLPKLKTLVLLWLPNLVSISSGLSIAANLKKIGFYYCPKLECLSTKEVSSDSLELIKGEKMWWEALKWDESEWESMRIGYLQSKFIPIEREKDVMSQMQEVLESPSREQSNYNT